MKDWIITRLDLAVNIDYLSKTDKKTYIKLLKKIHYPYCKEVNTYKTSVHAHNKSFCFNYYDKNAESKIPIKNTLRIENQFKNSSLYKITKSTSIVDKTLHSLLSNPKLLNNIFKDRLRNIGLDKKFLTKKEMTILLRKLYRNGEIGMKRYNNMKDYFLKENTYQIKSISKSTLNEYKKILNRYNCSHIMLDSKVSKKINFIQTFLFSNNQNNKLLKTYILFLIKGDIRMTKFLSDLLFIVLIKLTNYFDDS